MSVVARTARGQPLTVLQAAGGAPPFDEVWAPAEDEGGPFLVSEGGDIATAGFADFTTWVVVRKEDGTVVRHATDGFSLVAGLLMLDDVVVVAFGTEGPWFP